MENDLNHIHQQFKYRRSNLVYKHNWKIYENVTNILKIKNYILKL